MVGRQSIFGGIASISIALGCGEEAGLIQLPGEPGGSAGRADPDTVIESLESDSVSVRDGSFVEGAPAPSSDMALAQIARLTGPPAVTNGGVAVLHVELSAPVAAPIFAVQLEGDDGYYTVAGVDPDNDGIYDISVKVPSDTAKTSMQVGVALLDAMGHAGAYRELTIELVASGIGDVKVTLSFDRLHDLDLHVIEPSGAEIFYQTPSSPTGGRLDLDSGADCQPGASNGENVFWPPGGAPAGTYRVSVQNYQQCSPGEIAFTVRIAHDDVVRTYDGSFPDGSAGEAPTSATVLDIATFER
jgi:hypothetical protein